MPLLPFPCLGSLAVMLAIAAPALGASLPDAGHFPEAPAHAAAAPAAPAQWWRAFGDPILDGLVRQGLRAGVGVEEAAARLAQARGRLIAADATRRPTVSLDVNTSNQAGPLINALGAEGNLTEASARLSYELDILGRLSRSRQAARADVRAGAALLQDARLLTEADIARAYVSLRAADQEVRLLHDAADSARATLRITQGRRQSGFETDLAVSRAEAELGSIQSDALAAERRRHELEHALGFLVGDPQLTVAPAASPAAMAAPPAIPAGIPSEVLARRPDIAAAQADLNAAQLRLGVARTAWLPNLTLTASGGFASPQLGELISSSMRSFGLDLLMALPPFDGGRRKSGIAAAQAELDLARAHYRRQVLTAFRDVDDQLSALRLLDEQAAVAARTAAAADRALALSSSRRGNGLASELEVLDARRTDLKDRRAQVQVKSARYLATISLIQALGGGWDATGASPPQPAD